MRKLFQFLCFVSVLQTFSLSALSHPLADLIDDTQSVVIIAHDVPALLDRVQTSPWADTWNDADVKKFLAPLREKIRYDDWPTLIRDNTGQSLDALQKLFPKHIMLALPRNAEPQLGILLAADLGENSEKIRALIETLNPTDDFPNTNTPPETYDGIPLHTFTFAPALSKKPQSPNPLLWAISGNTLLVSPSRDTLLRAIDSRQRGASPHSFSQSKPYLAQRTDTFTTSAPSIYVHLSIPAVLSNPKIPLPVSAALYEALGLTTLEDFTLVLSLRPASTRIETFLTFSEKRGLLNLLTFDDASLTLPSCASASWPAFSVANYDIPAVFNALEEVAATYSPRLFAAYQDRLDEAADSYSINVKRDLIGSMGGQVITATVIPPGLSPDSPNVSTQAGSLYVIQLRDPRTFQNTLAGIIRATGLENNPAISKRDYLGATIYAYDSESDHISIAVAKNQFILTAGAPGITESIVQNIINGAPAPISSDPTVRAAFDAAPSDIHYFTTQDMRFLLRRFTATLSKLPQTRDLVNPDALPATVTFEKHWDHIHAWLIEKSDTFNATAEIPYKK